MSCCWSMNLERGGGVVWIRRGAGVWICVMYGVYVHARRVRCAVVVDRVGSVSFGNLPYELGVEVEGVIGLHISGRHVIVFGDLVRVGVDELGGETVSDDLIEVIAENYGLHHGFLVILAHAVDGTD